LARSNNATAEPDWWSAEFAYRVPIQLTNPNRLPRLNEPVIAIVDFGPGTHPNSARLVTADGQEVPSQLFDERWQDGLVASAGIAFLANVVGDQETYHVYFDAGNRGLPTYPGVVQLTPLLADGVKRLDTGYYILELCRGTADGTAAGKWGIRYFEAKLQGQNLINGCSNAIGGFYGPFFTPANGLINPPEHTIVQVDTEVEGPVYCRYRFRGDIPPGLDPNLRNKRFEIIWQFFANSPWFIRTYNVDPYHTVVDQMDVENKITVGDEFESGQDQVVFSRFGVYGETRYRAGDPYARILADGVARLLASPAAVASPGLRRFKDAVGDDINAVSWDYFWRLFSVKERILSDDEIRAHVQEILAEAHTAVHARPRSRDIHSGGLIDVSQEPDETIFPLDASKTVELNPETGYAMVWRTSSSVARYQIVQRPASGWVNWGTNGENEYPELPIGSTIHTSYGQFDHWEDEADRMEMPLRPSVGAIVQRP
jgi:hypothetical protein